MPVYRSSQRYLRRYGLDLYSNKDTKTLIILPTDPDISVVDPTPVWNPGLLTDHVALSSGNTTHYDIPYTTNRHVIQIIMIQGEIQLYFHDTTTTPITLHENQVPYNFEIPLHFIDTVYMTAISNANFIINVFEIMARDITQYT